MGWGLCPQCSPAGLSPSPAPEPGGSVPSSGAEQEHPGVTSWQVWAQAGKRDVGHSFPLCLMAGWHPRITRSVALGAGGSSQGQAGHSVAIK